MKKTKVNHWTDCLGCWPYPFLVLVICGYYWLNNIPGNIPSVVYSYYIVCHSVGRFYHILSCPSNWPLAFACRHNYFYHWYPANWLHKVGIRRRFKCIYRRLCSITKQGDRSRCCHQSRNFIRTKFIQINYLKKTLCGTVLLSLHCLSHFHLLDTKSRSQRRTVRNELYKYVSIQSQNYYKCYN